MPPLNRLSVLVSKNTRVGQKEALDTAFADSYGIAYHYRLFVRLIYKRIGFSLDQYAYSVATIWCNDVAKSMC